MKKISIATGLAFILCATAGASAADVAMSIRVGEPGFYGQIDIGNVPQPRLIYERPVIIQAPPVSALPPPIYLHVPPGHAKDWSKHCRHYNACGRPVYFVDSGWYSNVYVPEYRKNHGKGKGRDDGDHGNGRGRDGDDDRGNGNGNGKGKGHKKD
jgi:hypothetical protein